MDTFKTKMFLSVKSRLTREAHIHRFFSLLQFKTHPTGFWISMLAVLSVVAVSGQREFLTLLGLKEGVGQCDGVHPGHPGVIIKLRVNVEEDGHVHLFVRVQTLLLKAETLQTGDGRTPD